MSLFGFDQPEAAVGRTASLAAVGAISGMLLLAAPAAARAVPVTSWHAVSPSAGSAGRPMSGPAPSGRQRQVCPLTSQPGLMSCQSVVNLPTAAQREQAARAGAAAGPTAGYGPGSLRSAYRLTGASARDGSGETVAVVDAHSNPELAANLAVYRSHYGLPACTTGNGCLRIVNEQGQPGPLPTPSAEWGLEESLDLDVVSAICPRCHILLVEARTALVSDLGVAEQTAAASGARFISDSWDAPEFVGETGYDRDFDFPGVAVAVAAGDYGYAALYPASSPYVTAVGGTTLNRDRKSARGWTERVWGESEAAGRFGDPYTPGTGSGCSMLEPKPAWQRAKVDDNPAGCLNRTVADVAAVADPATGVAVYDSYATRLYGAGSWLDVGGTSAATPLIAATYALAGTPARGTYPASYPYRHASDLFNVTTGTNGTCEASRRYLCHGEPGYNGPTGLGTPDGTGAFSDHGAVPVTLVDPGTQDATTGSRFSVRITGLDARPGARSLSYSATGLPAGLSIGVLAHSTDAVIAGILPAAAATRWVSVTAKDPVSRRAGSVRFMIVSAPALNVGNAAAGAVALRAGGCLDAGADRAGLSATVTHCDGTARQRWVYASAGVPGGGGTLSSHGGLCLQRSGPTVALAACQAGSAAQLWTLAGLGWLRNDLGGCLAVPGLPATSRVGIAGCSRVPDMRWTLPSGLLVSGVGGECAYSLAGDSTQAPFTVAPCDGGAAAQQMALNADGSVQIGQECMDVPGPFEVGSSLDGAAVTQNLCVAGVQPDLSQIWLLGPGGELINDFSGKCLADPDGGAGGTPLLQEDCYGEAGEIWAVN